MPRSSTPTNFERSQAPCVSECVRRRDVARQRQHQADRVLRGGDGVALGGVDDDDAALGRRLDVDVVDADAGAADDQQLGRGLEDRRR